MESQKVSIHMDGLFQLRSRKDTCEARAAKARNEYLLAMAAANAHHIRFYSTDLPELMKVWYTVVFCPMLTNFCFPLSLF